MRIFLAFVFVLISALGLFFVTASSVMAGSVGIAAVVNQGAISISDLDERAKLIIISSGLPQTEEIYQKVRQQAIGSLIEEEIKLQEAAHLGLEVSDEEVEQGFATIAQQNNVPVEQFKEMVRRSGINKATMERQIRAQIAWTKVVQKQVRPKVFVSPKDIEDAIARMQANKGKKEYFLAEIFLPVEDPKAEKDVRQLANRLVGEIKSDKAPFFKVAQEFSKAAGASNGGMLGWVQAEQLGKDIAQTVEGMEKNSVSKPVRSVNGYHIMFLRDVRLISDETIPDEDQMMNILGTQRLERAQRRYYLDLKAASFIENRLGS